MEYKGYNIREEKNRVVVGNVHNFNPKHTFECGQCFRWMKQEDGSYTGVAMGRVVNIKHHNGIMEIDNSSTEDFINIWYEYFDLGRDYSHIKLKVSKDDIMKEAVNYGDGIRILKQDVWETLISFIISANNRIPMIMKAVDALSRMYGNALHYRGNTFYTFPAVDKLSEADIEEVSLCKAGFRCKYITATARMVKNGDVDLKKLEDLTACEARAELTRFPGVGDKVADCTILYSGTRHDVFPTDVWVKRIMEVLYFKREASFKEIQEFAGNYFGEYRGFAQQYLFYYAREHRIGTE